MLWLNQRRRNQMANSCTVKRAKFTKPLAPAATVDRPDLLAVWPVRAF
jgi:hypothetical protein